MQNNTFFASRYMTKWKGKGGWRIQSIPSLYRHATKKFSGQAKFLEMRALR